MIEANPLRGMKLAVPDVDIFFSHVVLLLLVFLNLRQPESVNIDELSDEIRHHLLYRTTRRSNRN